MYTGNELYQVSQELGKPQQNALEFFLAPPSDLEQLLRSFAVLDILVIGLWLSVYILNGTLGLLLEPRMPTIYLMVAAVCVWYEHAFLCDAAAMAQQPTKQRQQIVAPTRNSSKEKKNASTVLGSVDRHKGSYNCEGKTSTSTWNKKSTFIFARNVA